MAFSTSNFYPLFGISSLRGQRGQRWADLVDSVSKLSPADPHVMAFTMTMRRLSRAYNLPTSTCSDPFCAVCAAQVVASFDGSEQELLDLYYKNLHDVQAALKNMPVRVPVRERTVVAA
jgi:hypothetical protein